MNTAFLTAHKILAEVYFDKAFSAITLNRYLNGAASSDRSLITKLVYGVLDTDIQTDYIVSRFVKKTNKQAQLFLKMGTYCLMNLSVPVYAVVNDIAELSKITGDRYLVGFVNATLKNIATSIKNNNISYPDGDKGFCIEHSYPEWAFAKLVRDYGREEARNIASYRLPVSDCVRVNTAAISVSEFKKLAQATLTPTMLPDAFRVKGRIRGVSEKCYTMQSLASMLVARAVGATGVCRVLDCCSAPGGKAVYIKQLDHDASVTAQELHPHRVKLIADYFNRMGESAEIVCGDATVFNPHWENAFDYVLCDVPCSGFGVLDSRPDIKLFRRNEDISSLMKLQQAILSNCSRYVKNGGTLVYSTCTIFRHENMACVEKFLKSNSDFSLCPIYLPEYAPVNGQTHYQFLPHKDKIQGFFVAKMVKRIKS